MPVTTCTDLLRPGGYARLNRYLENLGDQEVAKMSLGQASRAIHVASWAARFLFDPDDLGLKRLDVFEPERRLHRAVVEDLQGGDFVLVLGDEGFEGLHQALGAFGGGGAEAGFDEIVLRRAAQGPRPFKVATTTSPPFRVTRKSSWTAFTPLTMPRARLLRSWPPLASTTLALSASVMSRSRRARRAATDRLSSDSR